MSYIPKRKKNETLNQYHLRLSPKARNLLHSDKKPRKRRSDFGKSHVVRKTSKIPMLASEMVEWGRFNNITTKRDYEERFRGDSSAPSCNQIIDVFGSWTNFRKRVCNDFTSVSNNYYDFDKHGDESYLRLCISLGYRGGTKADYNAVRGNNPSGALLPPGAIVKRFGGFVVFKNLVLSLLDDLSINRIVDESFLRGYRLNDKEIFALGIDIKGIKNRLGKRLYNKLILRKESKVFQGLGLAVNWAVWLREKKEVKDEE